jgi:protein O-GlcNAc transferase
LIPHSLLPAMSTVSVTLATAVAHHQAGRLQEAEASYRLVLQMQPDHAQAWYLFGGLAYQLGNREVAAQLIGQAAQLAPRSVDYSFDLGLILHEQGKLDAAAECYQRVLSLNPNHAEVQGKLGDVFRQQSRLDECAIAYRRSVELEPNSADSHDRLGLVLQQLGKFDEAIACHQRALRLQPAAAELHFNLGNAFNSKEMFDEAIVSFRQAIELKENFAEAHCNLGNALRAQGKLSEAVACYRRALELDSNFAVAHYNLGVGLRGQAKLPEAITAFRRAVEINPQFPRAHSSLLYTVVFCPGYDAAASHAEHRLYNELHAKPHSPLAPSYANDRTSNRPLKIGYVSPDYRGHVQSLFHMPLFGAHDHQQFEIICYSDVISPDAVTERIRGLVDGWRDIRSMTDEQVATLVRQDAIDILVDLTMHMERNRLLVFARKPAPVQVTFLAYPGTTGLDAIDYRLTDPHLDPPGMFDQHYSEESVRLPDTFWCYDPLTSEPGVNRLPALDAGYVTFGSLNNFYKVNPGVLKLWAAVLREVERSRLMLLAPEESSSRQWVTEVFRDDGIAADRIVFVERQPRLPYLELYHQIDIALDTLPYNGHTTSLDSLWMGVPVVTLVGQTVVGRAGLSQLTNLGLPELIAHTPDQFVQIAADLSSDLPRLSHLRSTLRSRMEQSPLMDAPRFARGIESAYRAMWDRWCVGTPSA